MLYFYFLLISTLFLQPFDLTAKSSDKSTDQTLPYERNPYVDPDVWDMLEPYFLPEDHPIRPALDKIFSKRVTQNLDTIDKAGFSSSIPQRKNGTIVSKHPKIKGYVVKLFTDDVQIDNDWQFWLKRVIGAQIVQEAIMRHGYYDLFEVPRKYIYPLPSEPSPKEGSFRKNFILIAEKMNILRSEDNEAHWYRKMNRRRLEAFHTLVEEEGLYDSCFAANAPFTEDGKQAFIDLEHYHEWPVKKMRLKKVLNKEMRIYWKYLITKDGIPYK